MAKYRIYRNADGTYSLKELNKFLFIRVWVNLCYHGVDGYGSYEELLKFTTVSAAKEYAKLRADAKKTQKPVLVEEYVC